MCLVFFVAPTRMKEPKERFLRTMMKCTSFHCVSYKKEARYCTCRNIVGKSFVLRFVGISFCKYAINGGWKGVSHACLEPKLTSCGLHTVLNQKSHVYGSRAFIWYGFALYLQKSSKGFFSWTTHCANWKSSRHNSPGKAFHDGERSLVLQRPVPKIYKHAHLFYSDSKVWDLNTLHK